MITFSFISNFKFCRNYTTLLTLVRHAQSAGNAKRPITFNYSQYPITELGECQAEKFVLNYSSEGYVKNIYNQIKSQVKEIQIESSTLKIKDKYNYKLNIKEDSTLIISSPFLRTFQTAKYLHEKIPGSKFVVDNRLHAFTYLDKAYYTSLRYCREKEKDKYWQKLDPLFVSGSEAESFKTFYERTLSFFHDVVKNGEDQKKEQESDKIIKIRNVVAFTHAMPCRMLEMLKFGLLPCYPNESTIIGSSLLLKSLKEREKGVSVQEAKEAMKNYYEFKKKRVVDNCEMVSCLL